MAVGGAVGATIAGALGGALDGTLDGAAGTQSPVAPPRPLAVSPRVRRTPFSSRVEAAGISGYTVYNHMLLPTMFRGLEADYWHLREHVQVWDVSAERQVEIRGPDAERLVQLMTTRNIERIAVGQCAYAPITDAAGGLLNDPVLLRLAPDRFWLSLADSDLLLWAAGLAHGLGLGVEISEPEVAPLAVQGPKAEALMARVFGAGVHDIRFFRFAWLAFEGHPMVVARSGWSKQGGFEIYLDRPELGPALWDALFAAGEDLAVAPGCPNLIERIESGLLSYGNDMTRANTPLECGLERFCDLDGGSPFIGRDALLRQRAEGVPRRITGIAFDGPASPPLVEPWPLMAGDERVGQVRSAAWSPALGTNVAIGMVDAAHVAPGTALRLVTPLGTAGAETRSLPFAVPPL